MLSCQAYWKIMYFERDVMTRRRDLKGQLINKHPLISCHKSSKRFFKEKLNQVNWSDLKRKPRKVRKTAYNQIQQKDLWSPSLSTGQKLLKGNNLLPWKGMDDWRRHRHRKGDNLVEHEDYTSWAKEAHVIGSTEKDVRRRPPSDRCTGRPQSHTDATLP